MAIFTAIGTAIAGALFAGSALAATIISSGLAFAANLGISYLRRPKKRKYAAVQGETQYGGDVPVGALFGTGKTKGQRIFYAKWGSGNKVNAEVFVLANGWNDGLEPYVYFFGKKHNLVVLPVIGNEAAHYGVEGFANNEGQYYLSFRFYDGQPGQGVDQKLVDDTAALGQTWKVTSVNAGLCYVIVQRVYDGDLFRNGKPEIEFVLRGLREYDPRKDSTIAGGSGPQRINDPSTWTHQLNPAVHRLNYQLGLKAVISGRTLIGEGKSLGQLDLGTYFVAMNVCDTLRTDGKKTYQCSLWVTADDDHTEILKEFDDAMAGYGINRRGLSGVIPGAPQIPVMEITADDIPADRAKEIQYRKSAFERYNYLSGQFLSIELMWNPDSLKPVYVNAHVAEDGRPRQTSNDFLQVTDPDLAQYLLYIRYRQNRMGGTATLPVSRRVGLKVQEGEWITWRGRTWMISEWMLDEQFRVTLKLSETSADIYDDEDIEPGPVVIPPTPPINPSLLSTVQNFGVEAGVITNSDGGDVPALKFTWDPPADPSITAVRFFYRPNDDGTELFEDQCNAPETGLYITTKNVVSDEVYIARATITTVPDRLKTYTGWVVTNDPTGTLYADVLNNSITAEKIANAAVTAAKIMDEAVTSLKLADQAVTTAKLEVGAVTQQILAAGSITLEKFVPGLEPITTVTGSLPTTKLTSVISFEGEVYTWDEATSAYVKPATGIEDGSVTANKLADAAVIASKLANGAVTHDKISAGSIYGDVIAAQAITARELYLTDFQNRLPNGGFEEGGDPHTYWTEISGQGVLAYLPAATYPGEVQSGERSLVLQKNADAMSGSISVISKSYIPVIPTQVLQCGTVILGNDGTAAVGAYVRFLWYDQQKVQLVATPFTDAIQNVPIPVAWTGYSVKVTVPTGAAFMRVRLINSSSQSTARNLIFDRVTVRIANAAALIVDGSIFANHLAVDSVTADKILASSVTSAKIAAAAITAEKMAIGLGRNLLGNTEFFGGETGWVTWNQAGVANRTVVLRHESDTWSLNGQPYTMAFEQPDANATAGVLQSSHGRYIPVVPGKKYEAFSHLGTHRCKGYVGVSFLDYQGNYITEYNSAVIDDNGGGGKIITNYAKIGIIFTVPAGASTAIFYMRKLPTQSGQNSYMFAVRPYFGEAGPNQNVFSEWTPGGVTYIGSDYLVTGAVIASKIGAQAVTAEKIAAGAITAEKIAAASITGDKVAANTIGTNHLVANSITVSKLYLTDFTNMADNGLDAGDFSAWSWGGGSPQYYKEGAGSPVSTAYVASTTTDWIAVSKLSSCKEGDAFMLEAWVYNADVSSPAISLFAAGEDGTGVWKTFSLAATTAVKGAWVKLQGRAVIPAGYGVQRVAFLVAKGTSSGRGYFAKPVMRRATNAEMIVDGSITADKLNVNSLTAISANFGNATVTGYIQSANGKMQLDFNNGYIVINS